MGSQDRRPSSVIEKDLLTKSKSFSYVQALRLLKLLKGKRTAGDLEDFLTKRLRVRPELTLGFPGTDIVSLEKEETRTGERWNMTTGFLGLYGSSSPLPTYYTEDLLDEAQNDHSVSREFLDIFNHRFYALMFLCWSKYRTFLRVIEEEDPASLDMLFCLLGLGVPELREELDNPVQALRYMGLFLHWPRSATGLQALVSDILKTHARIESCVPRRATIPRDQRMCLGKSNTTLGEDAYLGREIFDRMNKFRIQVDGLDAEHFHNTLPGSETFKQLSVMTGLYLSAPLECELEVAPIKEEACTACLGGTPEGRWAHLGLSTWVFSTDTLEGQPARIPLHTNRIRRGEQPC
ncbi:MAG: type VI secretion system baseplate subunit TssG [Desulfovibrio sp.]|uniref:type VI secretion system baseplate subunit TssG n=1 Tax=Desulfovibrio sp. 7SRBS1 TaxID=3378064 RepID=UPI003B3DA80A